jgi:rod shape-determining protein MreC
MSIEPGYKLSIKQAVVPVFDFLSRISLFLLLLACLGIILLSKTESEGMRQFRTAILDFTAPVVVLFSRPIDAVKEFSADSQAFMSVYDHNKHLRTRNEFLEQVRLTSVELKLENERLRTMLHMLPPQEIAFKTASLIANNNNLYGKNGVITGGKSQGLRAGQVVITGQGLVGRLYDVGSRSSRVLYVTDIKSRIPVTAGMAGEKAILAGGNSALMQLKFVSDDAQIAVGDRVLTSGDGRFFPAGLPVGQVESITKDQITVSPHVAFSRIGDVMVVDIKDMLTHEK